jgi:tRNA(Ile2) C34 agmatinyltransferase TiaS
MYWFKAEIVFRCPSCGEESRETLISSSPDHNPQAVGKAITERTKPVCQHCGTTPDPKAAGTIQLSLSDLSPEERAKLDIRHEPPPS